MTGGEMSTIREHPSYNQVMLDVNRCAGRLELMRQVYFHRTDHDNEDEGGTSDDTHDECQDCDANDDDEISTNQRELRSKLAKLIVKLLIAKQDLHYYQGFHDVCLTYMTLLGDEEAFIKLNKLIDSHFNIFMQPTMNETQDFLALIPIIIGLRDSKLQEFLEQAEVGTIFSLSWVITWFSHVITNEQDVQKIFEFLEKEDPHMVLYLCAEIVLLNRDKILILEAEMSTVHHFLCQIPRNGTLPIEELLKKSAKAYVKWPPELLKRRLDNHRAKLQLQNYNILRSFTNRMAPALSNIITTNAKTAILVLVVASAIALQFDRWIR